MEISPVAEYHCDLKGKFGLPRQAGLAASLPGTVRLLPPFNSGESLRGIDGFDYIWLLWGFSLNHPDASLTVRPPRLGGNRRIGVFASRSPFRPNGLGISCVRLESVDYSGCILNVSGADLSDGTPIYDIKPYVAYSDSREGAGCGFVDEVEWCPLKVEWASGVRDDLVLNGFSLRDLAVLEEILSQDPRPAYHGDSGKIYGIVFKDTDIRFSVASGIVRVQAWRAI